MDAGPGAAVERSGNIERMMRVDDDLGRTLELARPASRIVSLVPSLSETLFALGVGEAVVGITRYCVEPAARVAAVPKVGGTKNPDLHSIVALAPDLVIVNAEENRRADFDALVDAGLSVFVSYPQRVADTIGLIERIGRIVGAACKAGEVASELRTALTQAQAATHRQRVRTFCPIWKNPWMTFNADTYADDMLRLAGADNICADLHERYPSIDLEAIARLDPQVILLPDEPYVFAEKDLPSLAALRDTAALRAGRVYFIDGKALSWYGVRSAGGIASLRRLVDPGLP